MTLSRSPRHDRPRLSPSTDWLWGGFGITIASVSASFAAYMIATAPAKVTGSGSKDFNIFVHWDRRNPAYAAAADDRPTERPAPPAGTRTAAFPAIDPEPTGSIRPGAAPRTDRTSSTARAAGTLDMRDFVLRNVVGDKALIEHREKLTLVEAGSVLEGAGKVLAIERRGDGWVVRTAAGIIGGS